MKRATRATHTPVYHLAIQVGTRTKSMMQSMQCVVSNRDGWVRLTYVAIGFTPITTLALALFGVVPLHLSAPATIGFALVTGLILAARCPCLRKPAGQGLVTGLIAVIIYDCTRLPFVFFGGWPDFIPKIGGWLVNQPEVHWSWGYLWRYLGNGAGMGLAFAMIAPYCSKWIDLRLVAVLYGVSIWSCLVVTLLGAPEGQAKLFVLTPMSFMLSLVGHVVYGAVLGLVEWRGTR